MHEETTTQHVESKSRSRHWQRLLLATLFLAVFLVGFVNRDQLSLQQLAQREASFREFQEDHPIVVYVVAFLIYVVVTGASLPGAVPLTMLIAWYFGFWRGVVLVSFASTTGATVAFLLSRFLFRGWLQDRFGERLQSFNRSLETEGPFYLFTLRLIPAVPFFVINAVMGLTPMRTRTFWWVSQLGMLPGTCVYVLAGASLPDLQTLADEGVGGVLTWPLIIAFVLLGTFPIIVRLIVKRLRRRTPDPEERDV